jgi:phospholipase/carboxylesterase
MLRFFNRFERGQFDQESIKEETQKLHQFIESFMKEYSIQIEDIMFLGYSNGANMILAQLFYYPQDIYKAVLLHPMLPFTPQDDLDLHHTSILLTIGKNDELIPYNESVQLIEVLNKHHVSVTMKEYISGHMLTQEELDDVSLFLQQ